MFGYISAEWFRVGSILFMKVLFIFDNVLYVFLMIFICFNVRAQGSSKLSYGSRMVTKLGNILLESLGKKMSHRDDGVSVCLS